MTHFGVMLASEICSSSLKSSSPGGVRRRMNSFGTCTTHSCSPRPPGFRHMSAVRQPSDHPAVPYQTIRDIKCADKA